MCTSTPAGSWEGSPDRGPVARWPRTFGGIITGMTESAFVPGFAWVLPFVALLLCIAVVPLAAPAFWESNLRKLMVSSMMNGDEGMEDDPELESLMGGIMGCAFMGMGEDLGETDGMGEDTTTTAA